MFKYNLITVLYAWRKPGLYIITILLYIHLIILIYKYILVNLWIFPFVKINSCYIPAI